MASHNVRALEDDYLARRKGILRALCDDVDKFCEQCDPNRENLCLYGWPDGTWAVDLPADEVPAEMPEPALGINFARDGMQRKDWLGLVALHSDAWLLALAFYKGARLNRDEREELFMAINRQPTCYEVVSGKVRPPPPAPPPPPARSNGGTHGGSAHGSGSKRSTAPQATPKPKQGKRQAVSTDEEEGNEESEEEEDDEGEGKWKDGEGDPCPQCGGLYHKDEFWIACDFCDAWFCGRCAKMTEHKAQRVKAWRCEPCANGNP